MKSKETKEERVAKISAKQALIVALITSVIGLAGVIASKFIDSRTNQYNSISNSNTEQSRTAETGSSSEVEPRNEPNQSAESEPPSKPVTKSQTPKKKGDDTSHFDLLVHVPTSLKNSGVTLSINDELVMSGRPDSKGLLKVRLPIKYQEHGDIEVRIEASHHQGLRQIIKVVPYKKVITIDFSRQY